jgi:protein-S-isoprenylcysteine O-methyltransferase Ste14
MTKLALPSPRQLGVYAAAALLVLLAEPRFPTFVAGCVLVALALALRVWAFGHLEKNQHMVTTGPYAHTRNPAYLGSLLALIGLGLAAGNAETGRGVAIWGLTILFVAIFFVIYLPRKFAREYPRFQRKFGAELERHAANVPDFWPQLTPWRSGDPRRFSLRRVTDNHEWPWSLVFTALLAAIWFGPSWRP